MVVDEKFHQGILTAHMKHKIFFASPYHTLVLIKSIVAACISKQVKFI